MKAAVITDEHREWLKANYAHLSNRECRKHIGCGFARLREEVERCGLKWKSDVVAIQQKKSRHTDEGIIGNYCMDCSRYRVNGICGKTGKDVGALWQKKCFQATI